MRREVRRLPDCGGPQEPDEDQDRSHEIESTQVAPEPFFKWLQRQHGIGALLLPLAALIVLALSLWLNREPPASDEPAPFQDYPLDVGTPVSPGDDRFAPAPEPPPEDLSPPTEARKPREERVDRTPGAPVPPVEDLGTPMTGEAPAPPGAE